MTKMRKIAKVMGGGIATLGIIGYVSGATNTMTPE
jgi:hypothetical protein